MAAVVSREGEYRTGEEEQEEEEEAAHHAQPDPLCIRVAAVAHYFSIGEHCQTV